MKITKAVCTEECEVRVTVEDIPYPTETGIGFENRMVEMANRLILAPASTLQVYPKREDDSDA